MSTAALLAFAFLGFSQGPSNPQSPGSSPQPPAFIPQPASLGAKLVTVFGQNHARGLPSHLATILLLDPETGALLALLDGRYITEARTAAVSAVSVQHLARPDVGVLAILGTGVQGRSHLEAIRHVRRLTDVRVWSPTALHRDAFVVDMGTSTGLPIRAVATAAAATRDADIIVCATASHTPVIDSTDVADGAHIAAVGACRPDQREMPTALVARGRLYVDSHQAARKEAGDILIPQGEGAFGDEHILGELGDLINGGIPGRLTPRDVTIFKSLGLAVEDVVAATMAVDRATAAGLGHRFVLS